MNVCSTSIGDPTDTLTCPPLFDLLELVDAEEPPLLNQIQPLIETPDEYMRSTTTTNPSDTPLHTFPDPLPLQQSLYLQQEVDYRPEDQIPIWSQESFCESSPLHTHYQPSGVHFCPQWHSGEMEIQNEETAPQFILESPIPRAINPPLQVSSRIASPLTCITESTPTTPADYTPWTLPVLYSPSLATSTQSSPFSPCLSSSSELGPDTSLCSPYTSTMESEPEFYDGFEPEPGFLPEPALDLDLGLQPALQSTQVYAEQQLNAEHLSPVSGALPAHAHGDINMNSQFPFTGTCMPPATANQELVWSNNTNYTCENGHDGNHGEQYYLGECVAEVYSSFISSTDGESVNYNGEQNYESYSGFADVDDRAVSGNGEYPRNFSPHAYATNEHLPRADIHQVLEELNAMKPSLQSIPARTKRDYAQYHNTLAKLGSEKAEARENALRRVHREDFQKILGVSQLSTPTKATEITKPPARPSAPDLARARANLLRVPAIDHDSVAKLFTRKLKRNLEMESKSPLDTFIRGSKVIRLTHSYQQIVFKPDPVPKKRKTKKEVIEHIHQQIPEFSNLPLPPPKTTPKKPNKEFWKHLEF